MSSVVVLGQELVVVLIVLVVMGGWGKWQKIPRQVFGVDTRCIRIRFAFLLVPSPTENEIAASIT